jgi:streptogramin lyase
MGLVLPISGCGSGGTIPTDPTPAPPVVPPVTSYPGVAFTGTVQAGAQPGSQPVIGASVQLYAAGTTGNGSSPTALLTTALTTDTSGNFSVPAAYPCPASASQIYVVSRGGKLSTTSTNSAIVFLTTLGACNQLTAATHIVLNEVNTVANAWALSQFLVNGAKLGASATNTVGLANAVATAASLANPLTGVSPGATFPANGTSPAPRINTLANLLNSCITSDAAYVTCTGLLFSSSGGLLFSSATTTTLDAALAIVRNPGTSVAALYARSRTSSVFSPALATAPADWTLFLNFTGAGMASPSGIAVDSTGSVWAANYFNVASKFSPVGQPVFPFGITGYGLASSYGIAIDPRDNAWIPNQSSTFAVNGSLGSVTVFNSAGQPLSGNGFSQGGIDGPVTIAIDPTAVNSTTSTTWVLDNGNSHLTHLASDGSSLSGTSGYTSNFFIFPVALAIDAAHNVWLANQSSVTVTRVSSDGKTFDTYICCDAPSGLAIDQLGNVWVANYYGDSISELSSNGAVLINGYNASASINHPQGIAVDGAGSIWVANFRAAYLTQLASATSATPGKAISPLPGWAPDSKLFGAFAIAIDASGNIWVSNFNNDSITEFIGIATPVKTPLLGLPKAP